MFRIKMLPMQKKTDIFLQEVLLHKIKASYGILSTCDRLMLNQLDLAGENY